MKSPPLQQFLVCIHQLSDDTTTAEEWDAFFRLAGASGFFKGGSALRFNTTLGANTTHGLEPVPDGFLRFDAPDQESVLQLLQQHPVLKHGGSMTVYDMPKSSTED